MYYLFANLHKVNIFKSNISLLLNKELVYNKLMKSLIFFIKELPKPVRYSGAAYLGCLLCYNAGSSYIDAKNYLIKYRESTLDDNEKKDLKSEWDAVKYGASVNSLERLWNSLIWPITVTNNIIPWIVLTLNKKKIE